MENQKYQEAEGCNIITGTVVLTMFKSNVIYPSCVTPGTKA